MQQTTIEIELKFIVGDKSKIIEKLHSLSSECITPRTYELSVMYDNQEGLMQNSDGRIRLRKSGDTTEFCYKKPLTREGVKQEIEYQVTVSNYEMLEKIVKEMGFSKTTSYERYRTTFHLHNTQVTLDEYPFQDFLEIEGALDDITKAAELLGYSLGENLTDSCDTLFTNWRAEQGLPPTPHMIFDDSR
jgi:adenylate cyclase class 2